jgi:multidrug efflux pump subunit AcrA (membrane-fusion protein)
LSRRLLLAAAVLVGCPAPEEDVGLRSAAVLIESEDDVPEAAAGDAPRQPPIAGAPDGAWVTTGKVEPESWETASFAIPGIVAEVYVQRGDRVVAGQPLGRIDITERLERLEAASDGYETTKRSLPAARRQSADKPPDWLVAEMEERRAALQDELDRQDMDQMRIQRLAAAEEDPEAAAREIAVALSRRHTKVPRRETVRRAAKERLNIALVDDFRSRMNQLQADIDLAELASPIDGVVVDVNVFAGEQWNTRSTDPSFELMDPGSMVVRADLPLRRARLLVEGEPVWVEIPIDGQPRAMEGRVRAVSESPVYERERGGAVVAEARRVTIILPRSRPDGIGIGAPARVAFLQ